MACSYKRHKPKISINTEIFNIICAMHGMEIFMKKPTIFIILLIFIFCFSACTQQGEMPERILYENTDEMQLALPQDGETIAIIKTDLGDISLRLFANEAPIAVENFIGLAQSGYFNGISFHRVVSDFVIQSGDATGSGTGGATIWDNEAYPLEISDNLHHFTGAVGIAHSGDGKDNKSQFYIIQTKKNSISNSNAVSLTEDGMREETADIYKNIGGAPHLDNLHTVFAQVFDGMDVVDAIGALEVDENSQPIEPIYIISVEITQYILPLEPVSSIVQNNVSSNP